jgi:hypothetical protein
MCLASAADALVPRMANPRKPSKAMRIGWFHHHMAKARVWVRQSRTFQGTALGFGLLSMAAADRAKAHAWLRGERA